MNAVTPNPYAPPATDSFSQSPPPSMETLKELGPIPFAGSAENQDLREFLRRQDHVGWPFLAMLGLIVALVSLVLFIQGGGMAGIAIGIIGLFLVAATTSTLAYRRLVFENANPNWRQFSRGELRVDGIHIARHGTRAFFRWDWYWGAVIGNDWIAFLPATQPVQPLLVNRSMLPKLDDWQRLVGVASATASHSDDASEHQRRQQNLHLMQQPGRPPSIEVPTDAIAFNGILRANDLLRLPNRHRRRERPTRSYVVVGALLISGAFMLAGASNILFQRFAFLPTLVVTYAVLAAIGIGVRTARRRRARGDVVFYLNAYATESSIVSDFAITTTEIPWTALQLVARTGDYIAFRRREWIQFLVARRDMFADEASWRRFNHWVDRLGHD